MSMEPKVLLLGKVIWYRLESCLELNKVKVGLVMLLRPTSNSNANYLRNKDVSCLGPSPNASNNRRPWVVYGVEKLKFYFLMCHC